MRKTGNKRKSKLEYVEPNGILEIGRNLPPPSDDDDMLLIYFFPEIPSEIKHFPMRFPTLFSVDWKSPEFRALAMEMVSPIEKISLIYPPNDSVSIALHIRDGGASDPYNKEAGEGASKLPPFGFYPKGLRTVLELFPNKKIYCFVFTDSHTPGIYVEMLKNAVPETERITFEFHREVCGETHNVLQDLFSFFNFDVLIRPDSHFSMVPSLLHDFAVLYAPTDFSWETLAIETQTVIDEEKYRRLLQEKADSF